MKTIDRKAGIYFAAQGVAVLLWWIGLLFDAGFRSAFEMEPTGVALSSFWISDLFFLAPASLAASWLCFRSHEYKGIASWFVTGLVTTGTAYSFAITLNTDQGWLGVILMSPATLWSGVFSLGVSRLGDDMFRQTKEGSGGWMFAKTLSQIVIIWTLILGLFPYLIVLAESKAGISQIGFPGQGVIAAVLFVLVSIPGVWSARVMSLEGLGTPLPLDHASKLVVSGPYKYIRNPMAFSGIGQGLVVALFWGSPLVAVYALMGSAIWQWVFRPLEEEDLEKRFGEDYLEYKRAVRCWVPTFRR